MVSVAVAAQSSDTMSSSTLSMEAQGARKSLFKSAGAKFTSTKEPATARWPLSYVIYRHDVADQLGINYKPYHHYDKT